MPTKTRLLLGLPALCLVLGGAGNNPDWDWRSLDDMVEAASWAVGASVDRYAGSWDGERGVYVFTNAACRVELPMHPDLQQEWSDNTPRRGAKRWVEWHYEPSAARITRTCGDEQESLERFFVPMKHAFRTLKLQWAIHHLNRRWAETADDRREQERARATQRWANGFQGLFDGMQEDFASVGGGSDAVAAAEAMRFSPGGTTTVDWHPALHLHTATVLRDQGEPAITSKDGWRRWEESRAQVPGYATREPEEELALLWGWYPVYTIRGLKHGGIVGFVHPAQQDIAFDLVDLSEEQVGARLQAVIAAVLNGDPGAPEDLWLPGGSSTPTFDDAGDLRVVGQAIAPHGVAMWELLASMARRDAFPGARVQKTTHSLDAESNDVYSYLLEIDGRRVLVQHALDRVRPTRSALAVLAGDEAVLEALSKAADATRVRPAREVVEEQMLRLGDAFLQSITGPIQPVHGGFVSPEDGWTDTTDGFRIKPLKRDRPGHRIFERTIDLPTGVYNVLVVSGGDGPALHVDDVDPEFFLALPGYTVGAYRLEPYVMRVDRDGPHLVTVRGDRLANNHVRILNVRELPD